MSIILLSHSSDLVSAELVRVALQRSFSISQVASLSYEKFDLSWIKGRQIVCFLNPRDSERKILAELLSLQCKSIVLGSLGPGFANDIGIDVRSLDSGIHGLGEVRTSASQMFDASAASIVYNVEHGLLASLAIKGRPLSRYDFTDEWNTLGFGRITTEGSCWSISQLATATGAVPLAQVLDAAGAAVTVYAAIANTPPNPASPAHSYAADGVANRDRAAAAFPPASKPTAYLTLPLPRHKLPFAHKSPSNSSASVPKKVLVPPSLKTLNATVPAETSAQMRSCAPVPAFLRRAPDVPLLGRSHHMPRCR